MGFLRKIFGTNTNKKPDMDEIANRGVSNIGFFSEKSVYEAFIDAGLSEEDAKRETAKRVWHLD